MSFDESNIGIGIIYGIIAMGFLIMSYRKGHKLFFVLIQGLFCFMLYNVLVYSIFPIDIIKLSTRKFGIIDQVNSTDINRLLMFRFWRENIGVFSSFCSFTFIAAVLFQKMSKFYISFISCIGLLVIKTTKILLLNYNAGEIMEMIEVHKYLGVVVSCFIGYICYWIIWSLIPTQIIKFRTCRMRSKALDDTYEMSDI